MGISVSSWLRGLPLLYQPMKLTAKTGNFLELHGGGWRTMEDLLHGTMMLLAGEGRAGVRASSPVGLGLCPADRIAGNRRVPDRVW